MQNFIGIIVSQTGDPEVGVRYVGLTHTVIQSAIDYCNSMGGGKIFIEKGTYDIQSPINLYSNIEVYGEGIGTVLKPSFANSGDVGCLQAIGASGAELENIYIHDLLIGNTVDTKVGRHGIYCSYVGLAQTTGLTSGDYSRYDSTTVGADKPNKMGVRIENCHVQNNNSYGIYLNASNNNTITGSTVQNNNSYGIYLYSSANNTITGNTVQNNSNIGIWLYSSSNNTVTGNTVQNNSSMGIYVASSNNNSITGNTVQNNSYGIYLYSSNNTVTGNTVQNNSQGIYLNSSANNTVTGNTVQNNKVSGIYLTSSNNNTITGNTVQNNSNGIYLDYSSTNTVTGNTVQNNGGIGIYLYSSSNNSITGNTVQNNGSHGIYLGSSSNNNSITGNNYGSSSYGGSGNVTSENIQQA